MKTLLFILFTSISLFSFAQKELDPKWLTIPEDLKKDANTIIRDYQVEYLLKSSQDLEVKTTLVITILDNEGKSHAIQSWFYDDLFSKYIFGEISTYDKTGKFIEKTSLREMDDYSYTGSSFFDNLRYKYYDPEIKETPFTLIISSSEKITDFFQMPTWHPQPSSDIAVENASLTILNLGNVTFKINQNKTDGNNFTFIDELVNKRWVVKNIKAFKPEAFVKSSQLSSVSFPMKDFQVEGFPGSTNSWESLGQWSHMLNIGRDELPVETKNKILEMVKGIDNPKVKAEIIYAWMQENTRYISIQSGIGGWQPYKASEVDNLKYGDCKGLVNYTKALLSVVGIDSYYSEIYAGVGKKGFLPNFPSNQFNHVILCIPFEGDTTWAECTADNIALGYLGDFTDDRYALVVNGDQSKLVKTPSYSKENNSQIRQGTIAVNQDGSIYAKIHTSFSGLQFENRLEQINEDEKDRKDFLYKELDISSFTIKSLNYDYKKEILPEINEDIELEISKHANVTGSRLFIPLNLMNKRYYKPEKDTARKNTIFINLASSEVDSLVYQIPDGYEIERLPKAKTIESTFGKYSSNATIDGNHIIYVRKLEQNSGDFPSDSWEDFRKYKLEIVKEDKATAILKKAAI